MPEPSRLPQPRAESRAAVRPGSAASGAGSGECPRGGPASCPCPSDGAGEVDGRADAASRPAFGRAAAGAGRGGRGQSGGRKGSRPPCRPPPLGPSHRIGGGGGSGRGRLQAPGTDPMSHHDRHLSQAQPRAGLGPVAESRCHLSWLASGAGAWPPGASAPRLCQEGRGEKASRFAPVPRPRRQPGRWGASPGLGGVALPVSAGPERCKIPFTKQVASPPSLFKKYCLLLKPHALNRLCRQQGHQKGCSCRVHYKNRGAAPSAGRPPGLSLPSGPRGVAPASVREEVRPVDGAGLFRAPGCPDGVCPRDARRDTPASGFSSEKAR